jgi:AcrR family transcriptional regulator
LARQSERREVTRGALIAAARTCFAEQGFEATSTEAVLARAGVSKGALYHHFASKAELLAAVFETVSRETMAQAQAQAGTGPVRTVLAAALKAWLRAVLRPEPRRIILETGPAVLGLARARAIEETITQAPMRRAIERGVALGALRCDDPDLAARLLAATASELAVTAVQREMSAPELAGLDVWIDRMIDAVLSATGDTPR